MAITGTQRDQAIELLQSRGMMRLAEFQKAGVTAAAVGRMVRAGDLNRLARGGVATIVRPYLEALTANA